MEWELNDALAYYKTQGAPTDQAALIALLREIQTETGGISGIDIQTIAECYGIRQSLLLALIRRIPSLRLRGSHQLELCAGPNCGRHTDLAACAEKLQAQGKCTLKYVPCMRLCGKGPNIRWDGQLYHKADTQLLLQLAQGD